MKTTLGAIFLSVVVAQAPSVATAQTPWPPAGVSRPGEPGVANPLLVKSVEPSYTQEAMRAKLQGSVVLSAVVLADGTVGEIRVVKSLGLGLDENAVAAAKQWQFRPGTKNGTPVPVFVTFGVTFRLHDGPQPPLPPPAPFTWPDGFSPEFDTSVPGPGWKSDDEQTDTLKLHVSFPSRWTASKGSHANEWLTLMSMDSASLLVIAIVQPVAAPGLLGPMPAALLEQMPTRLAATPGFSGSEIRKVGQAKIGDQFWLWIDLTRPVDMAAVPPEAKTIMGLLRPEVHAITFMTTVGKENVLVVCTAIAPKEKSAEEADAQFRKAGAEFIAVLSRMTVTAR